MERIQSILVPTDFSPLSRLAGARAAMLSRIDGASVHLVHAVRFPLLATPYQLSVPAAVWEGVTRGAEECLDQERAALEALGVATVTAEVGGSSDPIQAITAAAEAHAPDLVVMGTHARSGISHAFLGSVAERAIRTLSLPVLAVKGDPEKGDAPIGRILLATDFSPSATRAASIARFLAGRLGASLDVLHVTEPAPSYATAIQGIEDQIQAAASQRLAAVCLELETADVPVQPHLLRGVPSHVIADVARSIGSDLVILGTHGHGGLAHLLLGSVAERTLRAAECSVLAVRADPGEAG